MRSELLACVVVAVGVIPIAGAMAQSKPVAPAPTASSASSVASSTLTASTSAIPQQVVWLRSGGIVRGEIVELVPNTRVVLQLATGEVRTIPWENVERASWVPAHEPTRSMPPTSASAPAPAPVASSALPFGVQLHLVGDRPGLRLEVRPRYGDGIWTPLCDAPCGSIFDVHRKALRVAGPGARPSNEFHIDGRVGEETLDVNAGSDDLHRWGQRSLIAGIGLALAGGLAYGLGRVEDEDAAVVSGVAGMALGGIGIAVALPLLGSSKTVVRNGQGDRVGSAAEDHRRW